MHVRQGWSGEVNPGKWVKVDVELEEADLTRLLIAADLDPQAPIRCALAFMLLATEAEALLTAKLTTFHGMDGTARLAQLATVRADVIEQIKAAQ